MSTWPSHVEPLDRAILDLLCSVPTTWIDHDGDQLTSTQQEAVRLMTRQGLIEQRVRIEAKITNINQTARMRARYTGVIRLNKLMEQIVHWLPDWLDEEGRPRGVIRLVSFGAEQIRLTDQEELARHRYENQTPECPSHVVAFVRKLGFYARYGDATSTLIIEECTIEDTATDTGSGPNQNLAAAQANASAAVGDVNVHHHTHITNDFGELATLLRQILDQGRSAAQQNAAATPVTEPTKSKPAGKKRGMSAADAEVKAAEILARDGWPGDLRSLAKLVGCSHETLRKCESVKPYLKRAASPVVDLSKGSVEQLVADDIDPVEALAYEEEFQSIYDQAKPAEQTKLDELTPAQRRRMVDLRRMQQQDDEDEDRPRYARRRRRV